MKIVPKPYYKCNYCDKISEKPDFKYVDTSGLYNNVYDLCSDKCRTKHIEYLKVAIIDKKERKEHIKEFIPVKK